MSKKSDLIEQIKKFSGSVALFPCDVSQKHGLGFSILIGHMYVYIISVDISPYIFFDIANSAVGKSIIIAILYF